MKRNNLCSVIFLFMLSSIVGRAQTIMKIYNTIKFNSDSLVTDVFLLEKVEDKYTIKTERVFETLSLIGISDSVIITQIDTINIYEKNIIEKKYKKLLLPLPKEMCHFGGVGVGVANTKLYWDEIHYTLNDNVIELINWGNRKCLTKKQRKKINSKGNEFIFFLNNKYSIGWQNKCVKNPK